MARISRVTGGSTPSRRSFKMALDPVKIILCQPSSLGYTRQGGGREAVTSHGPEIPQPMLHPPTLDIQTDISELKSHCLYSFRQAVESGRYIPAVRGVVLAPYGVTLVVVAGASGSSPQSLPIWCFIGSRRTIGPTSSKLSQHLTPSIALPWPSVFLARSGALRLRATTSANWRFCARSTLTSSFAALVRSSCSASLCREQESE